MKQHRTNYGIDAPMVPILYVLVGCSALCISVIELIHDQKSGYWILIYALFMLSGGGFHLHTSLRGKFLIWSNVFAELKLPENARILDLGCGHGAVLIKAAKFLGGSGEAVGVDLWRKVDQSGNDMHATEKNALIENVSNKIQLITADMTELPLQEESFDFIFSSLAIHNIKSKEGRDDALREATRVLKPGGTLIIADISKTKEYMRTLQSLSFKNLSRQNTGWIGWWTGPWLSTYLIKATKAKNNL
ncbi:class I SAM-dependent methyltransferase [Sporolactobacillus shoreicorticis]|uniref:Class I SAM-dependent methyltransferase n=1 Tax=Sporolactobacillus shoreicorticis TaxID=1923877 RepID=A0ABW5S2F7_9BACL|nr:class I SAM-dependent methyltransferase [Sporolactobacillus shoreicorticis]MCO7126486.1 class I SAM-dependent methyltransferase [Sporolactobacillus shoreicorticis]